MRQSSRYNILGFIFSISIYLLLLLSLALYLQERVKKNIDYTIKKDNILDITLVEKKADKILKHKKKIVKKTKKKTKVSTTPKPKRQTEKKVKKIVKKVSLQGLFKKIDTKKIVEPKNEITRQSRKKQRVKKQNIEPITKKDVAKKIVDSISFKRTQNLNSSKNGVYDKFRGKVQQILYENWQDTIDTVSGNSATVEIYIDKSGSFSYKIVKLSYNDEFNSKLVDFLEAMRDKEFPPFTEGDIFKLQVEFKDIRDD